MTTRPGALPKGALWALFCFRASRFLLTVCSSPVTTTSMDEKCAYPWCRATDISVLFLGRPLCHAHQIPNDPDEEVKWRAALKLPPKKTLTIAEFAAWRAGTTQPSSVPGTPPEPAAPDHEVNHERSDLPVPQA